MTDIPADAFSKAKTAGATKTSVTAPKFITWTALAFMTTGSVASLRAAPKMAVFGLAAVFLSVPPAIFFLVPQALVAAELASGWSGGVSRWVSEGLSGPMGLVAIWCQFAMTIFYYPTLLAYVASTLAYVINPALADSGLYTGIIIVVLFWTGVLVSARGMDAIAKLASSDLVLGTLIPRVILVVLGCVSPSPWPNLPTQDLAREHVCDQSTLISYLLFQFSRWRQTPVPRLVGRCRRCRRSGPSLLRPRPRLHVGTVGLRT